MPSNGVHHVPDLLAEIASLRHEVSALQRANDSLRESEQLHRVVVEAMPSGIVHVAADGAIVHANAHALDLLGMNYDQLIGRYVTAWETSTVYDDGRPCPVSDYPVVRCLATGQPQPPLTLGLRRPDGQVRWSIFTAVPLPGSASGQATGAIVTFVDITERKRIEAALLQSQERFRLLAENVPGTIYLCRNDARYSMLYLNDAVEALTGYSKAAFLDDRVSFTDLFHPDDIESVRRQVEQAVAEQRPYKLVYRLRRRDGWWRWIEETGVAFSQPGAGELLLEGYLSDVTERKEAEQALQAAHDDLEHRVEERTGELKAANQRLQDQMRERQRAEEALAAGERRLQAIIDSTNAIIYIKDLAGRYQMVNRRFRDVLLGGRSGVGLTDVDVFGLPFAEQLGRNDTWVLEHAAALTIEEVVPHPNELHYYVSAKFPLFDAAGRPHAICGISTDITEHKRTEEKLRLLQSAIEQVTDAVTITEAELDPPGPRIVYVNPAFERMTGYKAAEVIGKTPRILQGPSTDRRVLEQLRADLTQGRPFRGEAINYRKDGSTFTLEWRVSPIRDVNGGIINWVAIQRDVTEARRIEARARQHQAELAHVARLSTMGEMATGLAHELNQPLTAIANYSQGCLHRLELGQPVTQELRAALTHVADQAQRAGLIIRRMRSFVRNPEVHRSPVQVNHLIRDVMALCENDLQHSSVRCRLELAADLPLVIVDAIQIEQVILNLVRNSIDAMSELLVDDRVLWIWTWLSDGRVRVRVQDQGVGISEAVQARLFEPFHTTKPTGMGMGLAISRSIIESHGGRLTGQPASPRGAIFDFELPARSPRHERQLGGTA